jgi:hypothetical protein
MYICITYVIPTLCSCHYVHIPILFVIRAESNEPKSSNFGNDGGSSAAKLGSLAVCAVVVHHSILSYFLFEFLIFYICMHVLRLACMLGTHICKTVRMYSDVLHRRNHVHTNRYKVSVKSY